MPIEAALEAVERAIAVGPIPGAAVTVFDRNQRHCATFGRLAVEEAPVTAGTWYDLASLTKVLSTTTLLVDLIGQGRLDPRAPLREYIPEAAWMQESPSLADVTCVELATHTAGLPAWEPLYTLGLDRATLLARVIQAPLTASRGTIVYSDLGFIVLGHLIERLTGESLGTLSARTFARLGLDGKLGYSPPAEHTAPTELCHWRGRTLRGEVHDENAAALGGVAGHAGLFGTLEGVAGFAEAILRDQVWSRPLREFVVRCLPSAQLGERRAFGWALPAPGWSGGDLTSLDTIGHTGFTGTGIWVDLARERWSVLLCNRVSPSRYSDSKIARLRRLFNNAAHGA